MCLESWSILQMSLCVCGVHAGLVLMYESGIVVLDLADTAVGWPNDLVNNSSQQESRCESPVLVEHVAEARLSNQRLHACVHNSLSAYAFVSTIGHRQAHVITASVCTPHCMQQQHKMCWSVTAVHPENAAGGKHRCAAYCISSRFVLDGSSDCSPACSSGLLSERNEKSTP